MENLKTYINELTLELDEATTEEEAIQLSDKFSELSSVLHVYRTMIPENAPQELANVLDIELEHWEGVADLESRRAEAVAEELRQEKEDDEQYGTYEEQVRDTYYSGVL